MGYDYKSRSHIVLIPKGAHWVARLTAHVRVDPSSHPVRPKLLQLPDTIEIATVPSETNATNIPTPSVQPQGPTTIHVPLTTGWSRVLDTTGEQTGYRHVLSGTTSATPPTSEPLQPAQQQPNIDGVHCEEPTCRKTLSAKRQKAGERYCQPCKKRDETAQRQHNATLQFQQAQQAALNNTINHPPSNTANGDGSNPGVTPQDNAITPPPTADQGVTTNTGVSTETEEQHPQLPTPQPPPAPTPRVTPRVTRSQTKSKARKPGTFYKKLAAIVNCTTPAPQFNADGPNERIRKVVSSHHTGLPRYIRRYYSLLNRKYKPEPIEQIYRADVPTTTTNILSLATLMGTLRWLGTHHGTDDPLEPIRRAKAYTSTDWSDRIFYTYKQTQNKNNPYRNMMSEARQKELDALLLPGPNGRRPALVPIPRNLLPTNAKIGQLLTLYSYKKDVHGKVIKGKLRIAYNGSKDKMLADKPDCYANISPTNNIRTVLALTPDNPNDHTAFIGDIPTAYLWANNSETEYCALPTDLYPSDKNGLPTIARIDGALYGKINSGRLFEKKRDKFLTDTCGLTQGKLDPSIFYDVKRDIRLIAVVDDLFWRGSTAACNKLRQQLQQEFGDVGAREIGTEWQKYIGIMIRYTQHRFEWCSGRAVREALGRYNLHNIATSQIPATAHTYTCKYDRADPTTADAAHKQRTKGYQQRQGGLQWLVTTGRFDISLAVKHAASVMSSPKPEHIQLHRRIYGYLRRTQDIVLTWDVSRSKAKPNQLYYHTDGSYTGEGLQSRMGFVGSLNGGAVIADNQQPKFQCTGVFDVEEAAACWGAKDAIYRAALLTEIGYPQETIPMYCDNAATVLFSSRTQITSLNKHVAVRGAYTRELQTQGLIHLYSVPGTDNVSDQQTKHLPTPSFYRYLHDYGYHTIPLPTTVTHL